jgi:hypothetical protein
MIGTNKVCLGKIDQETVFLTKHKWDCDWYWAFGYVENSSWHFHIESLMKVETDVDKIFNPQWKTWVTQDIWWKLRDLFIQAYALNTAAGVYRLGGHQSPLRGLTDILKSKEKEDQLNKDLEILLDATWAFIVEKSTEVIEAAA